MGGIRVENGAQPVEAVLPAGEAPAKRQPKGSF
jgi:hypothetical protein